VNGQDGFGGSNNGFLFVGKHKNAEELYGLSCGWQLWLIRFAVMNGFVFLQFAPVLSGSVSFFE